MMPTPRMLMPMSLLPLPMHRRLIIKRHLNPRLLPHDTNRQLPRVDDTPPPLPFRPPQRRRTTFSRESSDGEDVVVARVVLDSYDEGRDEGRGVGIFGRGATAVG